MKLRFLRTSLLLALGLTLTTTVFTSCSSDDSNHTIVIKEVKQSVEARSEFTIDPKIDPTTHKFVWHNTTTQKKLSEEPILKYKIDYAETQTIALRVTSNTGVLEIYDYIVTAKYGETHNILNLKDIKLDLPVKGGSLWVDTFTNGARIEAKPFSFSHTVSTFGENKYWNGFIASNSTDQDDHKDKFASNMHGSMAKNTDKNGNALPFLVAYTEGITTKYAKGDVIDVNKAVTSVTLSDDKGQQLLPVEINVGLSPYTFYSIKNGDNFAKKFSKGDYYSIIVYGLDENKKVINNPIEYKLVEYKDDKGTINTNWQKIKLDKLGAAKYLVFYVDSSDKGEYGINTPALFTVKDLVVHKLVK